MNENYSFLLASFKAHIGELTSLCDGQKRRIEELETSLSVCEYERRQTEQNLAALQSKYTNLLTAKALAQDVNVLSNARKQVCRLVREVDNCISLVNK
jgi:flagellar biosynthesis chaperone FliJ